MHNEMLNLKKMLNCDTIFHEYNIINTAIVLLLDLVLKFVIMSSRHQMCAGVRLQEKDPLTFIVLSIWSLSVGIFQ